MSDTGSPPSYRRIQVFPSGEVSITDYLRDVQTRGTEQKDTQHDGEHQPRGAFVSSQEWPLGGVRTVGAVFSAMSWTRTVEPSRLRLCADGLWVGFSASAVTHWAFFSLR